MEDIKTLANVVVKNKIKQIDVIGNRESEDTQVQRLYEGIISNSIHDDRDIIDLFFAGKKHGKTYSSRLKGKLRDRLVNTLFFIDINQPDFNDYNRAYYTCYKQLAATKILLGRFARKAAVPLAEKALEQAIRFEFTDIIIFLAKDLRGHYGLVEGNKKRFDEMDQILETHTNVMFAELKAEKYYVDLRMNYVGSVAAKPELIQKANLYCQELEALMPSITSYFFNYMTFLVLTFRYEIANDYVSILKVSQKALNFFEGKKHVVSITALFSFNIRILICYIQLQQYEAAQKAIEVCLSYTRQGTTNWFVTLDYAMILSFHSGDFQSAYNTYMMAVNHPEFARQYETVSEHWRIHEAYIYYLISIGKIQPDAHNPVKKFRISRFVNEVPLFAKDKRGTNISIIIIQILFLLHGQEFGKIIDRMESLKTYNYRYLRRDDTFRSNCFIRMLLTLPECSFHKTAVLRRAQKYWELLQEVPLNVAKQSAEIELIPYELLWEFVLESLDEKWH